ncbi:hypothetical protein FSP39_001324 [Pinctada imbricata]|uniref:F5/8 type C domain-containing protein n=1 Tax=Pinctada imbricata TaxID=66713 RepID=A0AA88YK50_PINIB|nr:hypothetical protein FSP39_001324 [Pinctada imbricata]
MNVVHVDINTHEEGTGYTPLILAVLHGNRDIVENLLFYSAHVDVPDGKGNTPLHLAVWTGRQDLIHILLKDGAKVNMTNSDGDTPLHIACQVDIENRTQVINSLLRSSSDVGVRNKNNLLAIDIAAMYNRKDAVSELLDHAPYLSSTTSALVEASIRGYKDIVHLLLDYGVNPNLQDKDRQTCGLHEATRFARLEVAEILLKFGASSEIENEKKEVPFYVVHFVRSDSYVEKSSSTCIIFVFFDGPCPSSSDYPELPTLPEWTENSLDFCNECTAENPNTNLLDGQLDTFWVIPAVTQAWTILDLKYPHTLTGICIYSWDSTQMMKQFALQKADNTLGPWITVKTFYCDRKGSTDPTEPGIPQIFKDFTDTSQYWRINVLSNHGGLCTCFQAIKLFGADCRIKQMLDGYKMSKYSDAFFKAVSVISFYLIVFRN